MAKIILPDSLAERERRRTERRQNAAIAELTLTEVRRILITTLLGAAGLSLFLWMVKSVVIAAVLGVIIGFYLRPLHLCPVDKTGRPSLSGILTLLAVLLPAMSVLAY